MSEFVASTEINASADEVFAFVTDFNRMPEYMPTLHKATPAGDNRIRMQGQANGHPYDADGWFQTHEMERTMLWGSDGENRYSGHLEVMNQGDRCILTVALKFEASPGMDKEFEHLMNERRDKIQEGLQRSVESIKSCCEEAATHVPARNSGYVI